MMGIKVPKLRPIFNHKIGDLKGLHSIRINDQWRLVFKWEDGNAYEVQILDYHR